MSMSPRGQSVPLQDNKIFFCLVTSSICEIAKKENGEEYNEKVVENGSAIRMHASHALGELVESKACIFDDLALPDLMCKYQYEKEMSLSLEAYFEQLKKQDKEQTELTDAINDILNDEDDGDKE